MKSKVFFVDPQKIFQTEGPLIKIKHLSNWEYYDKDGIGMSNYLQVLVSIALYGIKYAVPITRSFKNLDGNFRVLAAKELDLPLPVVFVNHDSENRHPFIYKWLWRFRKLIRNKNFLKRKWINPTWKWKNKKIVLVTHWQKNLFGEIE